jgi:hypothetical protein
MTALSIRAAGRAIAFAVMLTNIVTRFRPQERIQRASRTTECTAGEIPEVKSRTEISYSLVVVAKEA